MRIKLFLLLVFLALNVQSATVVTNVSRLSGFGFVSSLKSTDFVAISVRQDASLTNDRLRAIIATNFVSSLTNMGLIGTGYVNSVVLAATNNLITIINATSNSIVHDVTNRVLIAAGTNVVVTTNVTGSNITYTIAVTNAFATGDTVWTNNGTLVYTLSSGSIVTNSIQIYTNGALTLGVSTVPFYGGLAGPNGESLISVRNITNEIDFNEIFIGVQGHTNQIWQDSFMQPSLNRRTHALQSGGITYSIDEYFDDSGDFVYKAEDDTGVIRWRFDPGASPGNTLYTFNSGFTRETNEVLFKVQNDTTNMITLWGDGKLAVQSQITNYFLTASKFVLSDAGKGLVSSAFGETDFVSTNTVNVIVSNYVSANITVGSFINLSVQAAKLPTTNYPGIDAGWQDWELLFPPTNSVGFTNPLVATWQFICPTNYTTNSMKVYGQSIILSTNGPTSTNIYWRASFLKATPGDTTDVHVGSFGSSVTVTQTWAASNTGTNKMQDFLIDMSTSSLLQRNDFAILKLERVNDIADTNQFKGSASLIGLQLRY